MNNLQLITQHLHSIAQRITVKGYQNAILQTALQNQQALALWRLPAQRTQHLIVGLEDKITQRRLDIEESPAGFAVSPFLNEDFKQTYFIPADLYFRFEGESIDFQSFNDEYSAAGKSFRQTVQSNIHTSQKNKLQKYFSKNALKSESNKEHHLKLVEKAIQSIQSHEFQKVVLSRNKQVGYPADFSPIDVFQRLCRIYPTAFCYFFHLPHIGTWMGASPETLISTDRNYTFRTVALAGTQRHNPAQKVSEALWSQKEIEEQALVSRYIINCFKKIRLREFEEEGPKTVIAGNLLHLKTNFSVDMQATHFPQLGSVMLELLHPTSAVCGMPKQEAMNFVRRNEGYDRAFYSGFLGPVNIQSESHLFVNLRCMQLTQEQIILYAGGGITEDSNPEKEWQETEMKCQTMQAVLE
jgi:isochorismate synthase